MNLRTVFLVLLVLLSRTAAASPKSYDRYKLFELFVAADAVVVGTIEEVDCKEFGLRIELPVRGDFDDDLIRVRRFQDWTCAGRWTPYEAGQHVLLFLHEPRFGEPWVILGGGGEGEMPLVGDNVIVRGFRIRGAPEGPHRVQSAEVHGAQVPLKELAQAVRSFRQAFVWRWESDQTALKVASPRFDEADVERYAVSSSTARHVTEQMMSSGVWRSAGKPELALADHGRRIEALALGLTGKNRLAPGREPDRFGFELYTGFGRSMAPLGDVDGDGVNDLAVGCPSDSWSGHFRGALWILLLDASGSVREVTEISEHSGGLPAMNEFSALGHACAPLGDLDGNGVPELLVSAPGWNGAANGQGGCWILFLRRDSTIERAVELGSQTIMQSAGVSTGHGLGQAVGCVGDLDGDGTLELIVSDEPRLDFSSKIGRSVYVVSVDRHGEVKRVGKIHESKSGFTDRYSWFGQALAAIGDLDGDGITEIAVSNPYDDDGGEARGAVWILFLDREGKLRNKSKISDWSGDFGGTLIDSAHFGETLAGRTSATL